MTSLINELAVKTIMDQRLREAAEARAMAKGRGRQGLDQRNGRSGLRERLGQEIVNLGWRVAGAGEPVPCIDHKRLITYPVVVGESPQAVSRG